MFQKMFQLIMLEKLDYMNMSMIFQLITLVLMLIVFQVFLKFNEEA